MIIRELVAKLTTDFDRKAFNEADKQITGMRKGLLTAGAVAAGIGGALAVGLTRMIGAAADANETLNLMGIVFEGNSEAVQRWADEVGAATGRSVFELREGVTVLGNALKGMTGDLGAATDMSQNLAERAVDFGSAMNIDLEGADGAISKFLAGLAGETEPLRRFGINMSVAALEAFALEKGVTKAWKSMDEAEKTTLRYQFLMEKTAQFQGDAAETSEAYANATRALQTGIHDLDVRIGLKFLPIAEKVVRVSRDVVERLGEWVEKSKVVEASVIVLGSVAAAAAVALTAAFWPVIAPILLAAAAIAALVLIVDDFLVFLDGGDSVIGHFIDSIWGPGSAAKAVDGLHQVMDGLVMLWQDVLLPTLEDLDKALGYVFEQLWLDVKWVWDKLQRFFGWLEQQGIAFAKWAGFDVSAATGEEVANRRGLGRATQRGFDPSSAITGKEDHPRRGLPPATVARPLAAVSEDRLRREFGGGQTSNSVSVTVQGNATNETARRIATDAGEAMKRLQRRTRAGLTQRAAE